MLRILILGTGSIGERHLRCFLQTGRAAVGFCEPRADLGEIIANRYPVCSHHASLEEALTHPWDAAVIAAPAHLHLALARQCAEAGLHVLIEKPLSTGFTGFAELRSLLREKSLVCSVAFVYRAHPALQAMRAALQSGQFGAPLQVTVTAGQHFPTYRPAYRETYYRDHRQGGGAIQDMMPHLLNAVEWLVGPADRLMADAAHQKLEDVTVEDTVHLLTRHGQVMGSFQLNQHQAPNESTITVICERGTARFEYHHSRWRWMEGPEQPWQDDPHPLERDDLFTTQAARFLDAIEGITAPACTLDEAAQTLRTCLGALNQTAHPPWLEVSDPMKSPPRGTVWEAFDLTGRTALVSGASGHLGKALARALAEAGCRIVVSSRSLATAEAVVADLPGVATGPHLAVALDQQDPASLETGFNAALQAAGTIDILVNNGHEALGKDWKTVTQEEFTHHLGNAAAYFTLARRLRDHVVSRGVPGSVIMLGSMYGSVGSYPEVYEGVTAISPVAYHTLKGGVLQMTRHLAVCWAGDGVRVNTLSPGPFPSPTVNPELVRRLEEKSPLRRMGQPDELAGAVVFLASSASRYMTGQNLVIDGGWTAW